MEWWSHSRKAGEERCAVTVLCIVSIYFKTMWHLNSPTDHALCGPVVPGLWCCQFTRLPLQGVFELADQILSGRGLRHATDSQFPKLVKQASSVLTYNTRKCISWQVWKYILCCVLAKSEMKVLFVLLWLFSFILENYSPSPHYKLVFGYSNTIITCHLWSLVPSAAEIFKTFNLMCRICMCIVYAYWYVYMYRALLCMFLMRECACVRVLHVCVSTFCMCVLYVRRYAEVNNYLFFASAPGWGVCVHVHVYARVCVCEVSRAKCNCNCVVVYCLSRSF